MKLADHIRGNGKTVADAAVELGYPHETVRKWARDERVPRPDAMEKIRVWSNGAVQPNDFYTLTPGVAAE